MKAELRARILKQRNALSIQSRQASSERIIANLSAKPFFKSAKAVLSYVSTGSEVDTAALLITLLATKELYLPRVKVDKLECIRVTDLNTLRPGSYAIPEPVEGQSIDVSRLDLIIVPGLVFDHDGYRIGYGKGYFDRLLAEFKGISVGLAFDLQIIPRCPREKWDMPVSFVITEQ